MLEQISWSSYLTFITFLTFLYYGWVYLKYFRGTLFNSSTANDGRFVALQNRDQKSSEKGSVINSQIEPELPKHIPLIYADMIYEMEALMEQIDHSALDKISFLNKLRSISAKYKAVENSSDKILLTRIIQQKGHLLCSCELSDEEMAYVWGGA